MRAALSARISRRERFLFSLIAVRQVSAPGEDFTALLDMPFNRYRFYAHCAHGKRSRRLISQLKPTPGEIPFNATAEIN